MLSILWLSHKDLPLICQRLKAVGVAATLLGAPGAIRAKTSLDSPSSSGAVITHLSYQLSLKSWNARCNLLKTNSWNMLERENRLLENEMASINPYKSYMLQFQYSFRGMQSSSSETSKPWPSCDYHGSLNETKSVEWEIAHGILMHLAWTRRKFWDLLIADQTFLANKKPSPGNSLSARVSIFSVLYTGVIWGGPLFHLQHGFLAPQGNWELSLTTFLRSHWTFPGAECVSTIQQNQFPPMRMATLDYRRSPVRVPSICYHLSSLNTSLSSVLVPVPPRF